MLQVYYTTYGLSLNMSKSTIHTISLYSVVCTVAAQLKNSIPTSSPCRQKIQLMRGHFTLLFYIIICIPNLGTKVEISLAKYLSICLVMIDQDDLTLSTEI